MPKVSQEILTVLSSGQVEGKVFKIVSGQLDRKLYMGVNQILENIGGKWSRKDKGHIFTDDPTDKIEEVLLTGESVNEKKEFQFFETPKQLAKKMVDMACINKTDILLEPSAGRGAIIDCFPAVNRQTCIELNKNNAKALREKGYYPLEMDFLEFDDKGFDKIIMNPPFSKQQDIDHVLHAYNLLNNGGCIISIMSVGFTFRMNRKSSCFREFIEDNGSYEYLDNDVFKESGTLVRTVLVKLNKK